MAPNPGSQRQHLRLGGSPQMLTGVVAEQAAPTTAIPLLEGFHRVQFAIEGVLRQGPQAAAQHEQHRIREHVGAQHGLAQPVGAQLQRQLQGRRLIKAQAIKGAIAAQQLASSSNRWWP